MVLEIKTTGIEQYLPGGEANLKLMVIGGPGAGKTRWASYFPNPIYADCEAGLASVADRQVPYVGINSSADMLQFLRYLKNECAKPHAERQFGTVVIDTLDAFQRKVKDEWLQANPSAPSFSGFDAWGYLDAKMQMLMTRLLNLDMNVVVLVHYKDKIVTEGRGENKTETHQLMLQLQGDIKDSAFNDFDLVGWMGTFWKAGGEDQGRVQARGLSFKPTPDKPFLKDRLHVTPEWMEIEFADSDYEKLFTAFLSRVDDLKESEEVGVIEEQPDEHPIAGEGVVGPLGGGPVPPQDPKDMPLDQLTKEELIKMGRAMPSIKDEIKTNLLKAELVELVEKGRKLEAQEQEAETPVEPEKPAQESQEKEEQPQEEVKQPAQQAEEAPESSPEPSTDVQAGDVVEDGHSGPVNTQTGEILTPEQVAKELGGQVISDDESADTADTEDEGPPAALEPPQPKKETSDEPKACEVCGKDLTGENQDYVKLAWIKFRKLLCSEHYQEAKKG